MGVETLAIASLVIGAAGTVSSIQQGKKAAKAQKKQAAAQRQAEEVRAVRARKDAIRQAAIKRAQIQASTGALGLSESSGAVGGISSIGSQLGGQFTASTQRQGFLEQASIQGQKASQFGSNASAFGDIAGLGFSVFQNQGGFGAFGGGDAAPTATPVAPAPTNVGTFLS